LDHVCGVAAVKEATDAPILLHPDDRMLYDRLPEQAKAFTMSASNGPPPDQALEPGQPVEVGGLTFEVRHTPGHSPGSVSFILHGEDEGDGLVIPGDTVFAGSIGRTDLWGGDYAQLIQSIKSELMSLPEGYRMIPGHGPETTVGREKSSNPFLVGGGGAFGR
ncbi:MAG: MBL fold metallo-hydrolase, partial [Myxococcota bacterium]|nr:MBL fold metallo-hydrolase [Myxococcota bacterium]